MKKDDTRRDSAAGEAVQTEGAALVAVSALMEERRRYEGWLSALDARRAATTEHVFERVRRDYTTRLDAVIVQLTSHAEGLKRELETLTSRLGALTEEHQRAQDERAEAELRAHVGELSAEDWQRSAAESDDRLGGLASRRSDVELELTRTRELLDSTVRPAPSAAAASPRMPESPPAAPTGADARPPRQSRGGDAVPSEAAMSDSAPPMELSASIIAAEQRLLDIEERPARASAAVSAPVASAAPSSPPAETNAPAPPPAPRKTAGFDELAFLSSVVDTPAGAFDTAPADEPDEKSRRDTFARRSQEEAIVHLADGTTPLGSPTIEREGDPLISAAAAGSSAMRRDSAADGVKSLKCSECGAMNYPTEWYCERCGAELASL